MIILLIISVLIPAVTIFLRTERFGKHPSGKRLATIKQSPNYSNGSFQNLTKTPMLTEGITYGKVFSEYFFASKPKSPTHIPSVKTRLQDLNPSDNVLIWMGHSSYFMQLDGKRILVDPVFSGNASPLSFTTKAFEGSDIYTPAEIPDIDYLFLSHDHWDHMDYKTLKKLQPKVHQVFTGLGNGAHLEHWGYSAKKITEGDWYQSFHLENDFSVHVTPARHFSGRGFKRNQTLWASFVLTTPSHNIYLGGDSGYGTHFKEIGQKYGPFDLAILENGQYDKKWQYIHMLPREQLKAAQDLNTKKILPVHSGKFTLANHDWDEPLNKITQQTIQSDTQILTPMIGEQVDLLGSKQAFTNWWNK